MYVVVALHEATGRVAGMTEPAFAPSEPERGYQGDTAVLDEFRGRGIGRFIKAEVMRWITTERPKTRTVTTSTATDNAPMIRVNQQLGYRAQPTLVDHQADLDQLVRHRGPA